MNPSADRWRRVALAHAPWLLVGLLGVVLLWPVPMGRMPLSADHTVHLTRIWMYADALANGAPRGWSPVWFFGTPIGDLYPVLGDLLVIAVRMLSLGLLDWAQAYAIGFTIVFVSQGWAMLRLGRVAKGGAWAGLLGAALLLCDAGAYREGGWIYGVEYGVWPQTLATTFTWLAIAEIVVALESMEPRVYARAVVRGALCVGAAMLAHPVTLPVIAVVAVVAIAVYGSTGRRALAEVLFAGIAIVGLGLALSAWWVAPMTHERAWMVSYGWLWMPLERMIAAATHGHLAQNIPMAVTCAVALGTLVVAAVGSRAARLFVAAGVVLWIWTSSDTLWTLRLDLVAPGSTQVQWQRFLVAAKPGLYFAAAYGLVAIARGAVHLWARDRRWRPAAIAVGLVVAACLGWVARDQSVQMRESRVGSPQVERDPQDAELERDYVALREHLAAAWAEGTRDWRLTVVAPRNVHWFMDAPVTTGVPLYKQGFTPGDNFVHKPEAGTPELLDLLGVRWVVTRKRGGQRDATAVATFGSLRLWERNSWRPTPPAFVRGNADAVVEVIENDIAGGRVVVRVSGTSPDDRLVFTVAGYPRWELARDGVPVEWIEVPALGDGPVATQAERREGLWRGGKALGDDGTEPTLLAAPAADGTWELRYRIWRARDVLAAIASLLAALLCVSFVRPIRRFDGAAVLERVRTTVVARLRPWMVVLVVAIGLAIAVQRVRTGTAVEAERAVGWVDRGEVVASNVLAAPFKTDMLVQSAVVLGRRSKPGAVVFSGVELGELLTGWFAVDDDAAKLPREGTQRVTIDARPIGASDWTALHTGKIAHQPNRQAFELATGALAGQRVELRVRIEGEGESPPPIGFDLDLGRPRG